MRGFTQLQRSAKFDTLSEITMLSDENTPMYSRPRLLEYLAGKVSFEQITMKNEQWYGKHNIELVTGAKVLSVTPQENKIVTSGGDISYDALLVASGASAATPAFFRPELKSVFRRAQKRMRSNHRRLRKMPYAAIIAEPSWY